MNTLKARPLDSHPAVFDRFLFRLLWCSVGAALAFAILPRGQIQIGFMISAVVVVSSLGTLMDSYRLKHPDVSVLVLRVLMAAVITVALVAYFFIRSSGI